MSSCKHMLTQTINKSNLRRSSKRITLEIYRSAQTSLAPCTVVIKTPQWELTGLDRHS